TADPLGYVRAYINGGSRVEPKFTACEMVPIFLSRFSAEEKLNEARLAPRICLFEWNRRGVFDMLVGNCGGEIFLLPNKGSAKAPDFAQPGPGSILSVSKSSSLWGNLFAPAAFDWNRDGKPDLLIGEG